jgi:hypothetical protein
LTIAAFPLSWPIGWKRTEAARRRGATFSKAADYRGRGKRELTIADGVERVLLELQRISVSREDVVISTNVPTRLDGFPRSDRGEPGDPGAAVYWQQGKRRRVMAIDHYDRVADNLAAIAATLDAMRAIERHGGAAILDRAFEGFTALPAPGERREWWEVLGVLQSSSVDQARAAWRRLASEHHPDRGGDPSRMAEINAAWERAQREARQ